MGSFRAEFRERRRQERRRGNHQSGVPVGELEVTRNAIRVVHRLEQITVVVTVSMSVVAVQHDVSRTADEQRGDDQQEQSCAEPGRTGHAGTIEPPDGFRKSATFGGEAEAPDGWKRHAAELHSPP